MIVKDKLTPAQAKFIISKKKYLWFCAGRGSGKCFGEDTKFMLADGSIKSVQDLTVHDSLMGWDYSPRKINGLVHGQDDLYKITALDFDSYHIVNSNHILTLYSISTGNIIDISLDDFNSKDINFKKDHYIFKSYNKNSENIEIEISEFIIEYKGYGDYYGVDMGLDGRILLHDKIVTHNTRIGSRWVYANAVNFPKARGLICANTFDQLNSATLPPVLAYFDEIGLKYYVNKRPPESWLKNTPVRLPKYNNVLTLETGAHIFLRSLDDPDPIRGIEYGWVWIDEISSSTQEAWDIIIAGLRDPECSQKCIRVTGTPDGDNWTWREFKKYKNPDPKISKEYDIIFMSSRENPFLPPDFIPSLLASYNRRRALQEIDGRIIVDNDSLIYYEWRPSIHMQTVKEYDPDKPLIMCWDFNASDKSPMSMVLAQQWNYSNGTPFVQVVDEIIIPSGNTPKVCEEFIKRYSEIHNSDVYIYGDSTGTSRAATVGINDYGMMDELMSRYFQNLYFRNEKRNMPEKDRRSAVNSLLLDSYGVAKLFISEKCVELIKDFDELKPNKHGMINKNDPERSHASDALGYYIAKEYPVSRELLSKKMQYEGMIVDI